MKNISQNLTLNTQCTPKVELRERYHLSKAFYSTKLIKNTDKLSK